MLGVVYIQPVIKSIAVKSYLSNLSNPSWDPGLYFDLLAVSAQRSGNFTDRFGYGSTAYVSRFGKSSQLRN